MIHGSYTVAREFHAPVDRVWSAYADPSVRSRWHLIPGHDSQHSLDFRIGGEERLRGSFAPMGETEVIEVTSRFVDIVDQERIVASYDLVLDGVRRIVSLLTLGFEPTERGTQLTQTEQYVVLVPTGDGSDDIGHLAGSARLRHNALAGLVEEAAHAS